MKEILVKPGAEIILGKRGENLARVVIFDISGWKRTYGEGRVHLLHQRNGDKTPYPCVVETDGDIARWELTDTDVDVAGRGRAELQYFVGEARVKSEMWVTRTDRSLNNEGPVPEGPGEDWLSAMLELGGNTAESAEEAQEAAETAARAAAESEEQAQLSKEHSELAQEHSDLAQEYSDRAKEYADIAKDSAESAESAWNDIVRVDDEGASIRDEYLENTELAAKVDELAGKVEDNEGVKDVVEQVEALGEQVTLNTDDIATLMAWKAEKEYVNISFVSAGHNRTGAVEKGTVFNDVTVSWSVSRVPTALTISGDGITGTENLPLAKSGSKTITGLNINADNASTFDWTVKATGEKATDIATAKVSGFNFRARVYYGSADLPAPIDSDFVKSLTRVSGLVSSKVTPIEVNGGGRYIWYCLPKSMSGAGTCSFMSNKFPFDMQEPQTVSVTNDLGYTETYYVYRSTNQIDVTMKIEVS